MYSDNRIHHSKNIIIFLIFAISLTACGKKATSTVTPTFTSTPPAATPTPDLAVPIVAPILPEAQPTPIATPIPVPTIVVQSALVEAPDLTTSIFVEYILDASGSMMGQLADHTRKRDVAEKVLAQRIRSFPFQIHIGFRAFGHHMDWRGQEDKSCKDIELIAPVQTGQLEKIASWLEKNYNARGMTPLAQSVRDAMEDLPKEGEVNNAIVLISDGKETCGGDPCAVVRQLKERGIHFTLHVVGMNVQPEDAEQLLCVARAGQGYYIPVQTAQEMNQALEKIEQHIAEGNEPVVAQLPTPTPAPPTATPIPQRTSGELLYTLSGVDSFDWAPDSTALAIGVWPKNGDPETQILDAYSGEVKSVIRGTRSTLWSPREHVIADASIDNGTMAYTWNADNGKILQKFDLGSRLAWKEAGPSIAWSPDGKQLAFITSSDVVQIWNASQGEFSHNLQPYNADTLGGLFWSPSGQFIASQAGYQIAVWEAQSGQSRNLLIGHNDNVWDILWYANSNLLASTSWDGTVIVWDAENGNQMISLPRHRPRLRSEDEAPTGQLTRKV